MTRRRPGWSVLGPLLAVAVALVVALALAARDDPDDGATDDEPAPVAVTSDAPRVGSLDELVAAADVVVRAEVVRTERGRVFGEPGSDAAIVSRLVTLEVAAVLAGAAPSGDTILLEEEGWTTDGAPLVVDGAAPSATGDDGVWFLQAVDGPEGPAYVVVSAQGRFLVGDDGALRGATGGDPLVADLARRSPDDLAAAIRAVDDR